MEAQRWQRVKELFGEALDCRPDARGVFLDHACGGDAVVRDEVAKLLASEEANRTFLGNPTIAQASAATTDGADLAPPPGLIDGAPLPPRDAVPGYELIREVSRGGQAIVFLANQKSTDRRVAIKVMREGPFASDREKARFDREAQILNALEHPNIVTVLERGVASNGSYFIAMPYIVGLPLDHYLADRRAANRGELPDTAEVLKLFMRICDAVNAAHLRGIVHRDLKPSNIRVDEAGEPHILDFGLARAGFGTGHEMSDDAGQPMPLTITGQFMGSLPWASPEQAEGLSSKIDVRSDVYSLGVILYQMLTGLFPYEVVGTMRDVLNNILTAKPTPPSQALASRAATERARAYEKGKPRRPRRRVEVNPQVEAIVLKALAKRPEDRYLSAGEFGRDVGLYLGGKPTVAAGLGRQAAWRHRWRVTGVATAALVLIAAVTIGVTKWLDGRRVSDASGSTAATHAVSPASAGSDAIPLPMAAMIDSILGHSPLNAFLPLGPLAQFGAREPANAVIVDVVGTVRGQVWGVDVYSGDSAVGAAAVHAGLLKDGERGSLLMTVLPGRDSYDGSTRHGVTSQPYGHWYQSFRLAPAPARVYVGPNVDSLVAYRGRVGRVVDLRVTGLAAGSVWGDGVYTDDSSIAAAAVHAGVLKVGQTGMLRVAILPGRNDYPSSTRNGVTSLQWGAWDGSFQFVSADAATKPTDK
jgi:serine/threonine protein kinase